MRFGIHDQPYFRWIRKKYTTRKRSNVTSVRSKGAQDIYSELRNVEAASFILLLLWTNLDGRYECRMYPKWWRAWGSVTPERGVLSTTSRKSGTLIVSETRWVRNTENVRDAEKRQERWLSHGRYMVWRKTSQFAYSSACNSRHCSSSTSSNSSCGGYISPSFSSKPSDKLPTLTFSSRWIYVLSLPRYPIFASPAATNLTSATNSLINSVRLRVSVRLYCRVRWSRMRSGHVRSASGVMSMSRICFRKGAGNFAKYTDAWNPSKWTTTLYIYQLM